MIDLYSTVLFADGEGIDLGDLNGLARLENARVFDQVVGGQVPGLALSGVTRPTYSAQNGANPPAAWAYCTNPGGAYLGPGSTSSKVRISAGTLLQKIANSTGSGASLVPFTFDGTSTAEFTLAAGNDSNPRWDMLQMKLEYVSSDPDSRDFMDETTRAITTNSIASTRRRIQCTLSTKNGTAAASPQIPEPDAGYVPVGIVYVPTSWSAAAGYAFGVEGTPTSMAFVYDERMPLGVRAYRVLAQDVQLVSNWAVITNAHQHGATTTPNEAWVPCPVSTGRLIGVAVDCSTPEATDAWAVCGVNFHGFVTIGPRATFNGGTGGENYFDRVAVDTPVIGSFGSVSATTKIGTPVWCNGIRVAFVTPDVTGTGGYTNSGNSHGQLVLRIKNDTVNQKIGAVTFYVAEGL